MTGQSFMGMRIVVSPDRPKYQLPADVTVPQAFREDFDRWALEFFGTTNLVPDGQMLVVHGRELVMSPRTVAAMKDELASREVRA